MLFTDLQMPVLDGFALAAAIRAEAASERLPIVALSARDSEGEAQRDRCSSVGIDETVVKPASLDSLRRALETWAVERSPSTPTAHAATRDGR